MFLAFKKKKKKHSLGFDLPILVISKISTECSEGPWFSAPWMETFQGGAGYISVYNLLYCPSKTSEKVCTEDLEIGRLFWKWGWEEVKQCSE